MLLAAALLACPTLTSNVLAQDSGKTDSVANAAADQEGASQKDNQADDSKTDSKTDSAAADAAAKKKKDGWIELKDSWKPCEFGGDGEITVNDGTITLDYGSPITGVKWGGSFDGDKGLPRDNFEIELEAQRLDGFDFLCALTFPVAKSHASLVMGGWGGGVTGLSSIDGYDASDNQTTVFQSYENKKWYRARVHVDQNQIIVWVNDQKMFSHPRSGHDFDIRFEMQSCTPLGLANYECKSQIRNVRIRRLKPSEITKPESDDDNAN
ncbi:hypothetical protein Pla52n_33380 [Stieleria varia]|uniref:3-keto-alpha-glucoside-1,2-lyase/3-keto-2-hydroxy-glucal hydratase domain-containing protein n=2 Tax=Stieleria varia TaxID=2528005 RepID=A0A5C6ART6_9BACT|nr:hypothetical protein Pla52n_33380 [Stieleria varia]